MSKIRCNITGVTSRLEMMRGRGRRAELPGARGSLAVVRAVQYRRLAV